MAVLKTVVEHLCQVWMEASPRTVLYSSSCTWQQQGTQWLETNMAFFKMFSFFVTFLLRVRVGVGGVKVRAGPFASVSWCVSLFPPCSTLCIVNMASASLSFWLCCRLPVCFVLTSSGLTGPGLALRQTSTCVCTVLGMWSVPGVDWATGPAEVLPVGRKVKGDFIGI